MTSKRPSSIRQRRLQLRRALLQLARLEGIGVLTREMSPLKGVSMTSGPRWKETGRKFYASDKWVSP
jgi:hypothetical protein